MVGWEFFLHRLSNIANLNMYVNQPYFSHSGFRPEAEENVFHRRKANRPSSAKANQTPALRKPPRPSSATRGQDNLNRVPSHYEPDPAVLARLKPRSITLEKERLYEDALTLKMQLNLVKEENIKLRTRIQQMDKERLRREELFEDSHNKDQFYGKTASSQHLVNSLKLAIKDLKTELGDKEEELKALRKNLKSTKVTEIEIEVQAYIDECTRLRHHLEEVMTTGLNPTIANYEQQLREQDDQIQGCIRENEELKEALRSAQSEVQKWRERMVGGGKKKIRKKGEAQQLKAEVQKLRAQLEAKEKKTGKNSESPPKRKEPSPKQSKAIQSTDIQPESKNPSERPSEKVRDLHNLDPPRRIESKHPELVVEGFLMKVSKLLLERKLSLAILLAYIYRSETGYCSAAELYTGLQTQGMAVDREEVEIVVRTVGDGGKITSTQFQTAYKRYEAAKNSFSAYNESVDSSRTNEVPVRPPELPVPSLPVPPPVLENKQKEAPSPMPPTQPQVSEPIKPSEVPKVRLEQVKSLLKHLSYRLQLQRMPKTKLFQSVFGSPFEKDAVVTLGELSECFTRPPVSFQRQESVLLARFLLETGGTETIKETEIKELRGVARDVITRLSSHLADWVVFTQEDESRFDHDIASSLQRNKMAFKASCKSYDLNKTGIISLQELLEIIKNLELQLNNDVIHYMTLLFYSHRQELDQVPYKEFIKAFTEQQSEQHSEQKVEEGKASSEPEHREEEAEGSEEEDYQEDEDDLTDEERAKIARYYLEQIANYLKSSKKTAEELFHPEKGYIMPENLVTGLLKIPDLQPQKAEIRVFLEALQDEEMEELCIAMDNLEMLLEHYGVGRGKKEESFREQRVSMLEEEEKSASSKPVQPQSLPHSSKSSQHYESDNYEEEDEDEPPEMVLSAEVLRQYLKKFGGRISNMLKKKGLTMKEWMGKKKEVSMEDFLKACKEIMSGKEDQTQLEGVFQCLQYQGKLNIEDFEDVLSSHGAIEVAE